MWLGFAICSFSFLCSILLVYLDWRQDILIQMKEIVSSNAGVTVQNIEEEKTIYSIKNLPKVKNYIFLLYLIYIFIIFNLFLLYLLKFIIQFIFIIFIKIYYSI
jgi:hypothetical protein